MNNVRWKNYGLWVAIGSLIVMVLNNTVGVEPEVAQPYVDIVLTIGIAAGIINNPSLGKGYKDE